MKNVLLLAAVFTIAPLLQPGQAQDWRSPLKRGQTSPLARGGGQRPMMPGTMTALGIATNSSVNRISTKPQKADLKVAERGADHRVWQYKTSQTNENGKVSEQVHTYTELGTGLSRKDPLTGQWIDADPEIVVAANGKGLAQKAQHSIQFQPNINTAGAIDLTTPTGNHLRSHVIAIYLHDWKKNQSLQIAGLQDSVGAIVDKNQVIYENALAGKGTRANVRYTFKKSGMSQDVIFQELVSAKDLQLNEETLEVEVWTEFLNAPQPTKRSEEEKATGLTNDRILNFGDIQIIPGFAFNAGDEKQRRKGTPVKKEWVTVQGRSFLIESVSYKSAMAELVKLPARPQAKNLKFRTQDLQLVQGRIAPTPLKLKSIPTDKLQVASLTTKEQGFVMDYEIVEYLDSWTFRSDTTYLISDMMWFSGISIEGGTVIKSSSGAELNSDMVTCFTKPYQPAFLTCVDDDSVGEIIDGSTGSPSGYYAGTALGVSSSASIEHLRVKYAYYAISVSSVPGYTQVENCQIVNCNSAISAWGYLYYEVPIRNCLIANCETALDGDATVTGEHLTIDQVNYLV